MESKDLIRGNENGTLDFGNDELTVKAKVPEYEFRGDVYKVKTFREITKLERNGMFVYESVPGTCVRGFRTGDNGVSFAVEGKEDAQITLELEDETEYRIFIDGANAGRMKTNVSGKLTISVELDGRPVDVKIAK